MAHRDVIGNRLTIRGAKVRKLAGRWSLAKLVIPMGVLASFFVPLGLDPTIALQASTSPSHAESFKQGNFDKAQRDGRLILVESYADWCAPCRIQAPIVERLRNEKRYRDLVVLRIDEDTPRSVWKDLEIAGFGQFVVFRGKREINRGSPLNEAEMRALLTG